MSIIERGSTIIMGALLFYFVQIKSRSQIFPLCGASVYEHVSRSGEVTYARDPGTGYLLMTNVHLMVHNLMKLMVIFSHL